MARILVVDDDADVAVLLRMTLEAEGYGVRVAADGQQALDAVAADVPDLVVLDLDMPNMGGLEVCERLKQAPATRLLPILILSGGDPAEARVHAWDLGADEFLTKPPNTQVLLSRCRSLLRVKRLVDELETAEEVVFAFARAVEAKCVFTRGHSDRVGRYAIALGAAIGLSADELQVLRRGAALHDIGKISLPDAILNKPTKLTADEYELVKQHPRQGVRILEGLRSVRETFPLVRWHHERLDGRGYPDGLFGGSIPLLVRVLSVADVYDALSSARPYRRALPPAQCFEILRTEGAGGGLDPELVRSFCQCMAGAPAAAATGMRGAC
jgi:putative two-component system response regulator